MACESNTRPSQDYLGSSVVDYKQEASESGNSPELLSADPNARFTGIGGGGRSKFNMEDLRRIGMKEQDVQMLMHKISAARADTDGGQDSDAEMQTCGTAPHTPAHEKQEASQDTGATMPLSVTTESHVPAAQQQALRGSNHPSPIALPPSPQGEVSVVKGPPSRLSLETPLKRDTSFAARSLEGTPTSASAVGLTPTNALSGLCLDSPASTSIKTAAPLRDAPPALTEQPKKPPPVEVEGLDAISALCFLASSPYNGRARDDDDDHTKDTGGLDLDGGDTESPRKRPRRNVERRNWSTLSGNSSGSSELGEARCLDDDELTDEVAAKVLASPAKSQHESSGSRGRGRGGAPQVHTLSLAAEASLPSLASPSKARASPKKPRTGTTLERSNSIGSSLLEAVAMEDGPEEEEDEELDRESDPEEDDEWSPADGDWSPKSRAKTPKSRAKASPGKGVTPGSRKGHRAYPNIPTSTGDAGDDDIELPVDVKKGGKIPDLIRSKRAASGFVGVDFHEGKWRARVRIGVGIRGQPNRLVIGRYATAGEAAIAYARYINSAAGKKLMAGGRG